MSDLNNKDFTEQKPENPPAFPTTWDSSHNASVITENGMTLRDYFAAKAMQAFATSPREYDVVNSHITCAKEAYLLADAMIKQREL